MSLKKSAALFFLKLQFLNELWPFSISNFPAPGWTPNPTHFVTIKLLVVAFTELDNCPINSSLVKVSYTWSCGVL